jgi:hypothetical protein
MTIDDGILAMVGLLVARQTIVKNEDGGGRLLVNVSCGVAVGVSALLLVLKLAGAL